MSASRLDSFPVSWQRAAAALVLFAAPTGAHAAEASVVFGGPGAPANFVDPVSAAGSLHVDNTTALVDYSGAASLATGAMNAKVGATPHSVFLSSPVASSAAMLVEQLKVVGPGTALVPLQLRMDVDALMTADPSMGANDGVTLTLSTYMTIDFAISSSMEVMRRKSFDSSGAINENSIECIGQPCDLNQPLTVAGVIDGQFVLNLNVQPGVNIPLTAYAVVYTYSNPEVFGEVDLSQQLSYTLPTGYTLSSQSGVFLTAVPEPSTALLTLAGVGLLAGLARRRATASPAPRTRCD
jgi:hypothetical protein